MDIGQWPRMLLALSGLAAGFLFDIRKRKIYDADDVLRDGALGAVCDCSPVGGAIPDRSSGRLCGPPDFLSCFFTTSFLELAACMRLPDLWAGMGRAVNNLVAALVTNGSVTLLLAAGVLR